MNITIEEDNIEFFKYNVEGILREALYPSNTLYPSDNLFPSTDEEE